MSDILPAAPCLPAMSEESIGRVRALESDLRRLPQVDPQTLHCIHAGMYARTVMIPAGHSMTGVKVTIDTILILAGDASVFNGGELLRLSGYHILPGSAGRKQAIHAHADTYLTMLFPTDSKTIEACENEFTDEAELLMSRAGGRFNQFYGGESQCRA